MMQNNYVIHSTLGLLACLLAMFSSTANCTLRIEITQGIEAAMPIAVLPMQWEGPEPTQVGINIDRIIRDDLLRSGYFQPLSPSKFPQHPKDASQVKYNVWRHAGVESLLITKIKSLGYKSYQVSLQLIDVFKGPSSHVDMEQNGKLTVRGGELIVNRDHILLNQVMTFNQVDFRALGHRLSDVVFESLTGIKGAFSTKVLYVSVDEITPKKRIFRLELSDSDGYNVQTLLNSSEPIMSPTWSPDGSQIAYVTFENKRPEIVLQTLATAKRETIASFTGMNSAPAWSPDGKKMALTLSKDGNPEIYVLDLPTKQLRRITRNRAIDTEAQWSPDSQALLFTSDRGGSPQLYRYSFNDNRTKRVTFEGDYNARGRYTPDGKQVVMVHRNKGSFHIATQSLENGHFYTLTKTDFDESPSIAPNGTMVIYATRYGQQDVLSAVSLDGRIKLRIPSQGERVREPAWSPFL